MVEQDKKPDALSNREEVFRQIYKIATELVHAGHVSEWDFKSYVLCMMFYRYLSEKLTFEENAREYSAPDGDQTFDYAKADDYVFSEDEFLDIQKTKGYCLRPSQLFCNVLKQADKDENLNQTLEAVFKAIEVSAKGGKSQACFAGLFDDFDVNSKSIGETVNKRNEVLRKLLHGVNKMPLFTKDGFDIFGDAYEYLMGMYAANAGKKGGQYFTPASVSELLARLGTINKIRIKNVYDPACGSGSLLLKVRKVLGATGVTNGFYGQEIELTTYNLCRMNMFLHDIEPDRFDIRREDTLTTPLHDEVQPFELIVSNPPFSVSWKGEKDPTLVNDPRFKVAGVLAPTSKGDMAFVMHCLSYLATNGTAAIVCFPGILFRKGAEQKIRKYLVDNNYIEAIVQLPQNLFLNVGIAACIMVLKKNKNNADTNILFVDASKEFIKRGKNNELSADNIKKIVNAVTERKDVPHFCRLASKDEIANKNKDYSLLISQYIEPKDTREVVNIVKLNQEINEIVERQKVLRAKIAKIIEEINLESTK